MKKKNCFFDLKCHLEIDKLKNYIKNNTNIWQTPQVKETETIPSKSTTSRKSNVNKNLQKNSSKRSRKKSSKRSRKKSPKKSSKQKLEEGSDYLTALIGSICTNVVLLIVSITSIYQLLCKSCKKLSHTRKFKATA